MSEESKRKINQGQENNSEFVTRGSPGCSSGNTSQNNEIPEIIRSGRSQLLPETKHQKKNQEPKFPLLISYKELPESLQEEKCHNKKEKNRENKSLLVENIKDPPKDFRQISTYPTSDEVLNNESFLRPNVLQGPYKNTEHYLDVQFRLVREDFLKPLRVAIQSLLNNSKASPNVIVYNNAIFIRREPVNEHSCYRIQLQLNINKKLDRLIPGSLICFTSDNFKTVLFGKVVESHLKFLEELKLNEVIIEFEQNNILLELNKHYTMVEYTVFFEPYFQVLSALKYMNGTTFPMEKYIIRLEMDTQPPKYLTNFECKYKFEGHEFSPLQTWPQNVFCNLSDSQLAAFRAALTQEFAVIQGFPGTGKTYIGLLIVKTLIENETCWHNKDPILVLSYTNNALDHFLEGVLAYTKNIIRVGGRSTNDNLKNYTVKNLNWDPNITIKDKIKKMNQIITDIKQIRTSLKQVDSFNGVLRLDEFNEITFKTQFYHKYKYKNAIFEWLMEGSHNSSTSQTCLQKLVKEVDVGDSSKFVVTLKSLHDQIRNFSKSQETSHIDKDNYYDLIRKYNYLSKRLKEGKENERSQIDIPNHENLINFELMNPDERWELYFYWLKKYKTKLTQSLEELFKKYQDLFKQYKQLKNLDFTKQLKEALIVGMTTTTAARLKSSLQYLKPPVVIVEEAAEIMEAHVASSITEECQHLILIGDHQQLKPITAIRSNLRISLFERMILNSNKHCILDTQYRMRKEIASLITPIYPSLKNHSSVLNRPTIRGVDKCVFFIDHDNPESHCEITSKMINKHEISFFIYFTKYILLNGYSPKNITILTPYTGQMYGFEEEMSKHIGLQQVRLSTLDNYQGEECDIILLSLVNNKKESGFLSVKNRISVALSTAKNGFYIMGNLTQLCNNKLWRKIKDLLLEQDAVGTELKLRCQIHPDVITPVASDDDFTKIPNGGCTETCGSILSCGHKCNLVCHLQNRLHEGYRCEEDCNRFCKENKSHKCYKKCYVKCVPCKYLTQKELPCGHQVEVECHVNPITYKCLLPCDKMLPCGHSCGLQCHHNQSDPGHLNYKCKKRCMRYLKGCTTKNEDHKCRKMCYEDCDQCTFLVKKQRTICPHIHEVPCNSNVDELTCKESCTKMLVCGHNCRKRCHEKCGSCDIKVTKSYPVCGHSGKFKCTEQPDRKFCNKKCPLKLPCGHPCSSKCNESCSTNCNVPVDCSIEAECGHIVTQIKCNILQNSTFNQGNSKLPLKFCNKPCETILKCGHTCTGTCSECFQGRFHKKCEKKETYSFICYHSLELLCKRAFDPCSLKCFYKCPHNACSKKCNEMCSACKKKCPRSCPHQQCTQICGDICSVGACKEPCDKLLKCGHGCIGFCGDPCPPKCFICDEEFFGNTNKSELVRYVILNDCKHIVESSVLESWFKSEESNFGFNTCPICKTVIITTLRYGDYVKKVMEDISAIKTLVSGSQKENKEKCQELFDRFFVLYRSCDTFTANLAVPKIKSLLESLEMQVKKWYKNSQNQAYKYKLETIASKLDVIEFILNISQSAKNVDKNFTFQINFVLSMLKQVEDYFTLQEIEDVPLEVTRLLRIFELNEIKSSTFYGTTNKMEVERTETEIKKYLFNGNRFSSDIDREVKNHLNVMAKLSATEINIWPNIGITLYLMLGFQKESWTKCKNDHVYFKSSHCKSCRKLII